MEKPKRKVQHIEAADSPQHPSKKVKTAIPKTDAKEKSNGKEKLKGKEDKEQKREKNEEKKEKKELKEENSFNSTSIALETSNKSFEDLGVIKQIADACRNLGWKSPSSIQAEAIPYGLQGRDIIGLAKTGSGKTGAFAIPILQKLLENPQPFFACVMAPTRELAFQISEQFEALGSIIGVHCTVLIGGVDMMQQAISLSKKPHIIVCSPGRLVDHLENTKGFNLRNIKFLVLDEADRLLNLDFEEAITKVLKVIPKERTTFLFSATMTSKVDKLQRASLTHPVKVEVSSKYSTVDTLLQHYIFIPSRHKDCYLTYILNELSGNSFIVFTNTQSNSQRLALMLRNLGFSAIPLYGSMSQPRRLGALNKFKSGSRSILIATDVASRGLDIPTVDVVINYDIPQHSKDYIHRVGRTARAGRSGKSITITTQYDVELLQRIEELIGKKMDLFPCEENEVMLLLDRVSEAQRIAVMEMKESALKGKDDNEEGGNKRNGYKFQGGKKRWKTPRKII